MFMKKRWIIS